MKMPFSSRQFVVRTESPISAVLISSFSAISSVCVRFLYGTRGMGSLPCGSRFIKARAMTDPGDWEAIYSRPDGIAYIVL